MFVEDLMLGVEMDLQIIDNSVVAVENVLKAWLHDQVGEREHLQLLLPAPGQMLGPKTNPAHSPKPGDLHHTHTQMASALHREQVLSYF